MEFDVNSNKIKSNKSMPLISILLAVYKPNIKWLEEQLISLNEQTYPNLELLVYDDCPEYPVDEELIGKCIKNYNYKLIRGIENKGSNKAFEELTKIATGDIFAYCDQDDIWETEKIEIMIKKFLDDDVTLVCSDLSIIDESGKRIANSITDVRKRHKFRSGYNLAKDLLMSNFVTGCAMLVKRDIAKRAIPYEDTLIHDQWIAIVAAINGKIEFVDKPLVRYRQHRSNQTGILTGINDKASYFNIRIQNIIERYNSLRKRLSFDNELEMYIIKTLYWLEARKRYFIKPSLKDLKKMIKYRKFHKVSVVIECFLPFIPNKVFKYIIALTKRGVL